MRMTKECIDDIVKKENLYRTPALNDILYLHCRGFTSIENLERYTGLKVLWLQGNALTQISNLSSQTQLTSLYLHENVISHLSNDALRHCRCLHTLDLSHNLISHVDPQSLRHLSHTLQTLNLAYNHLTAPSSVEALTELETLQTLDLRHNRLGSRFSDETPIVITTIATNDNENDDGLSSHPSTTDDDNTMYVDILSRCPSLRVLRLQNNPLCRTISNYRKTVIYHCRQLSYLDERPVTDEERRRCDAWGQVMTEEEEEVSRGDEQRQHDKVQRAREAERRVVEDLRRERRERDERNWDYWRDVWETNDYDASDGEQAVTMIPQDQGGSMDDDHHRRHCVTTEEGREVTIHGHGNVENVDGDDDDDNGSIRCVEGENSDVGCVIPSSATRMAATVVTNDAIWNDDDLPKPPSPTIVEKDVAKRLQRGCTLTNEWRNVDVDGKKMIGTMRTKTITTLVEELD